MSKVPPIVSPYQVSLCAGHVQGGAFVIVGGSHVYILVVVVEPVNKEHLDILIMLTTVAV